MRVRKFTEEGSLKFQDLMMRRPIGATDQSRLYADLQGLIVDDSITVESTIEFEFLPFTRRVDLGLFLWQALVIDGRLSSIDLGDAGLWNWLSAAWLKILVEADEGHTLESSIQDFKHWVLVENVRRSHWHFVSHPFLTLQANAGNVADSMAFLATPVLHPGDLVDKIGSNRRFLKAPVSILATAMYYDSGQGFLRKGITTRPGEVNQLSRYLNQIDQTVDFEEMSVIEILKVLPNNFKEWVDYAVLELGKSETRN